MPNKQKEKFNVGKTLPNMLDEANKKPAKKPIIPVPEKQFSWKRGLLIGLLVLVILFAASVGWLSWKFQKDCAKVFKGCTIFSLFDNRPLKGEENGRVNILVAGNSTDDPGHQGADLTDSIMLISVNTHNYTGYMLSIPRDLYVNYGTSDCPFGNAGKINVVYKCGEALKFNEAGYPKGGMGLLEKVVSQDFGVPINYYALVNYGAFRDAVDAVGGIDVTINSPDGRLYDPNKDWSTGGPLVDLSNGKHHLDGRQALDLARARGDPSPYGYPVGFGLSDYQRTANQRMMLVSLKQKVSSLGVLVNPIKLGKLLDAFGRNVQTDFRGNNIHRLTSIMRKVPDSKLKSVGLNNVDGKGKSLVTSYASYNSGSALIPAAGLENFDEIQSYIDNLNKN